MQIASVLAAPRDIVFTRRGSSALVQEKALAYLPQRSRLRAQIDIADAQIVLSKSAFYPTVVAGYQYTWDSTLSGVNSSGAYLALQFQPGAGLSAQSNEQVATSRKEAVQQELQALDLNLSAQVLAAMTELDALDAQLAPASALEIARAKDGDENLGDMLQEAYENGQLKGRQIIEAKRLIEKRQEHDPASPNADQIKPPTSSYSLVRTYQKEVDRQRKMVLKAEHAHQRLLLLVQGLKKLFTDESFVNLLRAEGLDTLPKYLSDRISAPDTSTPVINTTPQPELEGETV